ncbi:ATP-grasp domain-containing protein [Pseudomonas silvicola]|nr:ATP-grasp domain-containing protein [Pseudomonas silvicola]
MPTKLNVSRSLSGCKAVRFIIEDLNDAVLEYAGLDDVLIVRDFSNKKEIVGIVERFLNGCSFDYVVAMDEFSVLPAAYFREALDVRGMGQSQARTFRDKVVMKRKLSAAGVKTPIVFEYSEVASKLSFPLIIKPRALAGAVGVIRVDSFQDFKALHLGPESFVYDEFNDMSETEYHAESFVEGTLYHIDGVCIGKEPAFWCVGEYVNSQLGYLFGTPFGSCSQDRRQFGFVMVHLRQIFSALDFPDGAFHIEAFIRLSEQDLTVLEVAARPGGGEICRSIKLEYGVDIIHAHVQSQIGREVKQTFSNPSQHTAHGWISIPFLPDNSSDRLLAICLDAPANLQVLHRKSVPLGTKLCRSFYSHERSLASIIIKGERSAVLAEIENLCERQCYKVF